jgi:hypothetical protein
MLASKTTVPVLGVPVASRHLQGVDSLYSIVQMPKGMPVATFAIGNAGAANAALFAVAMLAVNDPALRAKLDAFRAAQTAAAEAMTLPPAPVSRRQAPPFPRFRPKAEVPCEHPERAAHPSRRHARRARRRPAGPHVRPRRPAHGLLHGGARPRRRQPAGRVSHHHIHTDYADVDGLARWPAWPTR